MFSGIQPSGDLHIGNYIGEVNPKIEQKDIKNTICDEGYQGFLAKNALE